MSVLTGGELLVESLAREGVKHVFSMPGGQLLPVYDSIRDHPWMELVVPRHEGAASLMAAGYSIASGGPAVVMSTVGAGVVYEMTGVLQAWRERLPLISIAPQVQSWRMKPIQESLQACDQDELYRPITKFRAIVYHYQRMPQLVSRAIRNALAPEAGPVHLDLPVDVLFEYRKSDASSLAKLFGPGRRRFEGAVLPDREALALAAAMIQDAERPLCLAGRGVERAKAGNSLAALLDKAGLPVISSDAAFGAVGRDNELCLGQAATWSGSAGMEALSRADLLLLLEPDEETARLALDIARANPEAKCVQSGASMASLGTLLPLGAALAGTPEAVIGELAKTAGDGKADRDRSWLDAVAGQKLMLEKAALESLCPGPRLDNIVATIETVSRSAGPGDYIVCEGPRVAGAARLRARAPGLHKTLLLPGETAPGAGLPLSMGIRAADPGARVFLLTESGRFKRHARELQSMPRYGLGVASVVFQEADERPGGEVDFAALAKSLGVPARRTLDPAEEISAEDLARVDKKEGMLFDASR